MKLTLGSAKSVVSKRIGVCADDPLVAEYINQATQRLLARGEWVGTYGRYRICINTGCITWPRQIETIESFAVCGNPGIIRNEWFEFIGSGPGVLGSSDTVGITMVDRGLVPAFDDVAGENKVLRVYADVTEATDAKILLRFYDNNGNVVRTQGSDGSWIEGEYVAISTTPINSTKRCMANGFYGVVKPKTNGVVRLYSYDTVTLAQKALAIYEPGETLPEYRRSLIPGISSLGCCCNTDACAKQTVDVMAKLKFIPVEFDNDFILIGNLSALKLAVMSVIKEEENLFDEANYLMEGRPANVNGVPKRVGGAIQILEDELTSHLGSGAVPVIRTLPNSVWGGGGVPNWI